MLANHDGAPVTFVNRFTVHASPEEFRATFAETSEFLAGQPGFVRHTLLAHTDEPNAFVNVAVWTDERSFRTAVSHPQFALHARALRALSVSEPNLYRTAQYRERP
jgi:heme-degrading monooxygenase HmoA